MQTPVSVTLLTGFLGAGKTTLLNYYLRHGTDRRLAIVENEFGAANLDGALLEVDDSVSVTELSNGCVCCSVRGEFSAALRDLLQRRQQGRSPSTISSSRAPGSPIRRRSCRPSSSNPRCATRYAWMR
ncbi:GTP-binding protein [Edwardsiella tarda]|uniref:GTP-binding protein n=1 Tax=Edwardsiella tarda TaxID=636 RepID=UPI00351C0E2B